MLGFESSVALGPALAESRTDLRALEGAWRRRVEQLLRGVEKDLTQKP